MENLQEEKKEFFKKELLKIKTQLKKDITPANFPTFISLAISMAKSLEEREAEFTLLKKPILEQLKLLQAQEDEHVGGLQKLLEEIKEKLLIFKKEEVIVEGSEGFVVEGLPKSFYGKGGGRVTFSSIPQYVFSPLVGEKDKVYRNEQRGEIFEDKFFMLDRVKIRATMKAGEIVNGVTREEKTVISIYKE